MKGYWTKTHSFTGGAARQFDTSYFSITQDNLSENEVQHTIFIGIVNKQWYQLSHVNWNSVGIVFITKPSELALSISENGQLWTYVSGKENDETFGYTPRLLRNIAIIGGEAYACGMDREVYRRIDQGQWKAMHAIKPTKSGFLGFEAIDGFTSKDIYAVGWEGEIWRFNGGKWFNCDSPVNLILTGVLCASGGSVYICGQEGLLLKGCKDTWEVVSIEGVTQDFWDVIEFKYKIYIATKSDVYELDNDKLTLVKVKSNSINSAGRFSVKDGVLWSIGEKDVFSFDGTDWVRLE